MQPETKPEAEVRWRDALCYTGGIIPFISHLTIRTILQYSYLRAAFLLTKMSRDDRLQQSSCVACLTLKQTAAQTSCPAGKALVHC